MTEEETRKSIAAYLARMARYARNYDVEVALSLAVAGVLKRDDTKANVQHPEDLFYAEPERLRVREPICECPTLAGFHESITCAFCGGFRKPKS